MPECYMCGMETEPIYKCKVCGERFCDDCGSPKDKLCLYCLEEDEEENENLDNKDEDDDWR